MNNRHFPGENCQMGPPPGVPESECSTITVFRGEDQSGKAIIISAWEMTPEELDLFRKTGRVYLIVWGSGTPPVALGVHNLFDPPGQERIMGLWNKYYHDLVTAADDVKGTLVAQILNNSNGETASVAVSALTADARKTLEAALHKQPAPADQKTLQQVMDDSKPKPSPDEGKVIKRLDPTVPPAEAVPSGPADSTVASPSPGLAGTVKK